VLAPVEIEYACLNPGERAAPLVVFLHEGLGSVSTWRDFPVRLCAAGRLRGLVYSRPGYGRSTARPAGARWEFHAGHHAKLAASATGNVLDSIAHLPAWQPSKPFERQRWARPIAQQSLATEVIGRPDAHPRVQLETVALDDERGPRRAPLGRRARRRPRCRRVAWSPLCRAP